MGIFQAGILEWVAMVYSRDPEWLPDASYYTTVGGRGFHGGSASKESACNMGDRGLSSGLGRSPGKGKGYPLQDSGLENSMDCIVHGVAKSWTWLSDLHIPHSLSIWSHLILPTDCSLIWHKGNWDKKRIKNILSTPGPKIRRRERKPGRLDSRGEVANHVLWKSLGFTAMRVPLPSKLSMLPLAILFYKNFLRLLVLYFFQVLALKIFLPMKLFHVCCSKNNVYFPLLSS